MSGEKGKVMSKLLARQAQKKQKQEEEQRALEAENAVDEESVEGSDTGSVNELSSIATSVRSFANARGTLMPSAKPGSGAFLNSRGGGPVDKPRATMSVRGSMAVPRFSKAPTSRESMAIPHTRPTMSARGTLSSNSLLGYPNMSNTLSMARANIEDSESMQRGEELLAQYALQEKQRHLKKIQNDNDRLAELLRDLMETKAAFMREISWIQMNKDALKSVNTENIEHQIATKLSHIMDNADTSEDDQVKEVYQHLSNFVSAVQANKEELTLLVLKKLEEAEAAISSKQESEISEVIASLRDFGHAPSATSRNLGALISEKVAKNLVTNTRNNLKSVVVEIGKDATMPSNMDPTKPVHVARPSDASEEPAAALPKKAPVAIPEEEKPLPLKTKESEPVSEVKPDPIADPIVVESDLLTLLNDIVYSLVDKNPIASKFPEQLKKVVALHVAKCCQTKLLASVDDASVYLENKDNFMNYEIVRAVVYSEMMVALTYTSQHSAANPAPSRSPSSVLSSSSVSKRSSVVASQQKEKAKSGIRKSSVGVELSRQYNEFDQSTMSLAPSEPSTASVPGYMKSTSKAVKSS